MSIPGGNSPRVNQGYLKSLEEYQRQIRLKPGTKNMTQIDLLANGFKQLHQDLVQLSSQIAKQGQAGH